MSGMCRRRAYHDGEAVIFLDTVLVTLFFGVLTAPELSVGGKVQVMVHNLTPLHEKQGPFLVQNTLLIQVTCNLVGYLTGLQKEREREREGWRKSALWIQIRLWFFEYLRYNKYI